MQPMIILDKKQLELTLNRLAFQLSEVYLDFDNTAFIGIQRTGARLSQALYAQILERNPAAKAEHGLLDVTFYRDDFGRRDKPLSAFSTEVNFPIEGKRIVLVDDVLYTGRTIRAALDALVTLGRPASVELLVLIDRRFSRQLPIEPSYTGKKVDSIATQHVKVDWDDKGFKGASLYERSDKS
jgi:pyrimidine operon attenuation protein/uracil phosphoribosyltransferase